MASPLTDKIIIEIRNHVPAPWGISEAEILYGMKNWNFASKGKTDVEYYAFLRNAIIITLVREKPFWLRIVTALTN